MGSKPSEKRQRPQPVVKKPRTIAFVSALPGEGKTTVASTAAHILRRRRAAVGVMIPIALGCRRERTRLVSPDAEVLAHHAEAPEDLATISPAGRTDNAPPYRKDDKGAGGVNLDEILSCYETIRQRSRIVLIELHGGLLLPIAPGVDQASLLEQMGAEVVVVGSSSADAFNQVMMTIDCVKSRNLSIAGVALNRYDPDRATSADEMNPEWIELFGRVDLPTMIPVGKNHSVDPPHLDRNLIEAVKPMVSGWLNKGVD